MKCKICGSERVKIVYKGQVRNGGLGVYTKDDIEMKQCLDCNVIWHEPILENKSYYESQEYRKSLEGTTEEQDFYRLHDKESLDKFIYTGTTIFRNKIVADIGCGCGAFLDYISGVAKKIIAVEPSQTYRKIMEKKGFITYDYATSAINEYSNKIDVITSFDVIEHVENPKEFISDIYELLKHEGKAIIGTPTDAPVMRELLGEIYERKLLFSTQHLWIFSEKSLRNISEEIGFRNISIKYYQRYGINNLLGWLRDKEPKSDINGGFISNLINETWKVELAEKGLSDYIVMYLEK